MLRQYLEIKEQHPGTILFYRMGDFYEMFFEDAETASRRGQKLLAVGLSFLDVSTGNFLLSELPLSDGRCEPVIDEITRMQPAELLLAAAPPSS